MNDFDKIEKIQKFLRNSWEYFDKIVGHKIPNFENFRNLLITTL